MKSRGWAGAGDAEAAAAAAEEGSIKPVSNPPQQKSIHPFLRSLEGVLRLCTFVRCVARVCVSVSSGVFASRLKGCVKCVREDR